MGDQDPAESMMQPSRALFLSGHFLSGHWRAEADIAAQIEIWRALIDDIKLHMHLGPRELRDRLEPHVKHAERGIERAKAELRELAETGDQDWPLVHRTLDGALRDLDEALEQIRRCLEQPDP